MVYIARKILIFPERFFRQRRDDCLDIYNFKEALGTSRDDGRAILTAPRLRIDIAQTLRARTNQGFFALRTKPRGQRVHRNDNEKIYCRRDQEKRYDRIDEIP